MKKTQAGLELLIITAMLLVFTLSINNIFFKLNFSALEISQREAMVSKCLDLNSLFSKILSNKDLSAKIRLEYNLSINSTERLMVIYSNNESYTCGLITSRVTNDLSQSEFDILAGEKILQNNGLGVVII